MFKFLVKVVIVVLAIQSGMSFLKKEEILVGEIRINYPVLKEKLLKIVPTNKITDKLLDVVNTKVSQALTTEKETKISIASENVIETFEQNKGSRTVVHVVAQGETLSELSSIYGISSLVIKKINNIQDEKQLSVGQRIRIPDRSKNLT
ncbi:LysM peptidoglycan-binding domain-containing protein [candidate division KSB1 bacterium]|nr:LysM peptidoglycan-binding domain-containing protein [candidate division KSB1 bacterium]MBL7095660.1 LysM peptidoglycan-binding domain-containing protein [candidate division KSB1 bacterium]